MNLFPLYNHMHHELDKAGIETPDLDARLIIEYCTNYRWADLIAKPEFEKMTKTPLIINASRGGLVNESDVLDALDKGLIGGAAFDVLTTEPPAEEHLFMAHLSRPNLIVTPHIAWASSQAMQILWDQLIGNIDHFARGTPRNMLKPAQ